MLAAIACALAPEASRAQERPLDEALGIVADDPCLERTALLDAVRAWLRRDGVEASLAVLVEAEGGAGSVVVVRDGEVRAARRFERLPARCEDRRAVLGLAVAIAIDAAIVDRMLPPLDAETVAPHAPAPGPLPRSPHAPAPGPLPRSPHAPPARGSPSAPPLVELGLEGGLALGMLPAPAVLASAGVGLVVDRTVRASVAAEATSPVARSLGSGHAEAMLVAAGAQGCLVRPDPVLDLGGCLTLTLGAVLARGIGYARSYSVAQPWVSAGARLELIAWLEPSVGLLFAVEARVPWLESRLDVVGPGGEVRLSETLPPAAALVSLGARFRVMP